MKKIFFSLALLSFVFTASAQTTTKRIFYGDKARNSRTNPCKGNTDQICAVFETTTSGLTDKWKITSSTPSIVSDVSNNSEVSSITVWRVPLHISNAEYQSIKALEIQYPDLIIVRGLEDEITDNEEFN